MWSGKSIKLSGKENDLLQTEFNFLQRELRFVKKKIKDEQNSFDPVEYANLIQACMQIQEQYLRVSDMVRRNRPIRTQIAGVYNVK